MTPRHDSHSVWKRGGAWLIRVTVATAVVVMLGFAILASLRAVYPYELEWIEGVNLDEIMWIADGRPVFGPPQVEYIPILYTPLYFGVSALLVNLMGPGFLAPRLVSILASLGCFYLLHRLVRQETGRTSAGLIAAGLYAATFFLTGKWMDLAKVDSLFLLLVLLAFACGRNIRGSEVRSGIWLAAGGILWAAAFFTKQLALPIAALFLPFSLAASRGRSWLLWLTALATGLTAYWILERMSAGWFSFFTVSTYTKHALNSDPWEFWKLIRGSMGPAVLLGVLYAAQFVRGALARRPALSGNPLLMIGFASALVLGSWGVYMKMWTYLNGLMPACLGLSLLAGLAIGRVIAWWEATPVGGARRADGLRFGGLAMCLALVLLQFGLLVRHPAEALPAAADRAAAQRFVERISRLPGAVLIHNHGYYGHLAGKGAWFNSVALGDVMGNSRPGSVDFDQRRQHVLEVHDRAVSSQRFEWVVVDEAAASWLPWYVNVDGFDFAPGVFYPVTGARTRPESLMRRNPVARGGVYPLTDPLWSGFLQGNWSEPQPWGRWFSGEDGPDAQPAGLRMALIQETGYEIRIALSLAESASLDEAGGPAPGDAATPCVQVDVQWNAQPVGIVCLAAGDEQTVNVSVSREMVREGLNDLQFLLKSPAREVRVRVTRIDIVAGSPPADG